jgi:deferrochelatase/peroxidase EfeB
MSHSFLTVAVPFDATRIADVEARLDAMGNPAKPEIRDLLRDQGIHFMSMAIVPNDLKHGAFLILEASADSEKDPVTTLVRALGQHLADAFAAAGLSASDLSVPAGLDRLLRRHSHTVGQSLFSTPGLCFAGTPGMSMGRIRDEYELSRKVREVLESGVLRGSPLQVLKQVREKIESTEFRHLLAQHSSPLLEPPLGATIPISRILGGVLLFAWPYLLAMLLVALLAGGIVGWQSGAFWGSVAFAFSLLVGLVGLLVIAGILYATLARLEATDVPDHSAPDPKRLADAVKRENRTEQNHLFGISTMKQGLVRNLILRVVYWVIVQVATTVSRPGFLNQLGTIHFARWILLPGTNKLLFCSNYGGSWESYLEDFITNAHQGLTGVWSNTIGFPRTKNVFQNGATDGDRFKRWARRQQHPTRFWYSAYPHLNTARIRLNSAIRQGLASAATEDEAAQWLSCMGSRPRVGAVIENYDVQAILFGGLGNLTHATCLLFHCPNSTENAKQWLARVEEGISFGDMPPKNITRLVALTQSGLRRLGCPSHVIAEFPVAFQEGMSTPGRAALLRDTGDDKPELWWWGHGDRAVDGALLLYADTSDKLANEVAEQVRRLKEKGGELVYEIPLAHLDPNKPAREPFGFVDGVSQPIIRGTRRWISDSDTNHVVAPGEFLLGYPDDRGFLPLTPSVPATSDPHNVLPAYRELQTGELPNFSKLAANGPRDLGRNGSYLVIRQLEQDVDLFNEFLSATAARLVGTPGVPEDFTQDQIAEWLGAKIIGRWRDGTSLVRHPHAPGTGWDGKKPRKPDNSFLPGAEDPLGERCPYGSHIRRANPRDSLVPGSKEQLAISNRHRILRMGRVYLPQPADSDAARPGLLFMCLNADIERQFEFIQHTWVGARMFHGLDGEVDPILGRGGLGGRLTIPTERGPILVTGFKDFVRVRGGAYFFLPGRRALWFLAAKSTAISAGDRYDLVSPTARYGRIAMEAGEGGFEQPAAGAGDVRPSWDSVH